MTKGFASICALSCALASGARAQDAISDHIGLVGVGFFTTEAPLGVRYWSGPETGFDLGLGLRSSSGNPVVRDGQATTTSLFAYAVEAGYLKVVGSDSNMITFLRPGVTIASEELITPVSASRGAPGDTEKDTETRLSFSLMLGLELFMTKLGFTNLSFGGGIGAAVTRISPAGGGDTRTVAGTVLADVSVVENAVLGFHFYF